MTKEQFFDMVKKHKSTNASTPEFRKQELEAIIEFPVGTRFAFKEDNSWHDVNTIYEKVDNDSWKITQVINGELNDEYTKSNNEVRIYVSNEFGSNARPTTYVLGYGSINNSLRRKEMKNKKSIKSGKYQKPADGWRKDRPLDPQDLCPKCHEPSLYWKGNKIKCYDCGYEFEDMNEITDFYTSPHVNIHNSRKSVKSSFVINYYDEAGYQSNNFIDANAKGLVSSPIGAMTFKTVEDAQEWIDTQAEKNVFDPEYCEIQSVDEIQSSRKLYNNHRSVSAFKRPLKSARDEAGYDYDYGKVDELCDRAIKEMNGNEDALFFSSSTFKDYDGFMLKGLYLEHITAEVGEDDPETIWTALCTELGMGDFSAQATGQEWLNHTLFVKWAGSIIKSSENIESARISEIVDEDAAEDLYLYAINTAELYHGRTKAVIDNLRKKYQKGVYDPEKAVALWQYVADDAAKMYDKELGSGRGSMTMFNKATRNEVAKRLAEYYEEHVTQ